ncbi:MAG: cysteine hydrolase family protein [Dehalococcoidia bacterium]
MANVVLVVDMLRGFCEQGYPLYVGEAIRQIIPNIGRLLKEEKAKGSHIIFLCDSHDPDDREFEMFPPHCIRGTEEAEIISELRHFADEIIPKNRFSGFYSTNLEERLRELNPDKIIVVGDCTDICVMHTVADARNRDYSVEVSADCVATFDEEAHRFALRHMEKILGARITGLPAEGTGAR